MHSCGCGTGPGRGGARTDWRVGKRVELGVLVPPGVRVRVANDGAGDPQRARDGLERVAAQGDAQVALPKPATLGPCVKAPVV